MPCASLSIDAVQAANSGHPGLPLGAAPMAYVLFTEFMHFNPQDPDWPNRDRFVLSAGHGSALLYSLLHLTGYDLSARRAEKLPPARLEDARSSGALCTPRASRSPPVPSGRASPTASAWPSPSASWPATFNRPGHDIIDHYTYGIVSDGDLMEGVAAEAASLAGHLGLGKLIYLYDQNEITLAGTIGLSFSEDIPARFRAVGWHVQEIDGMDTDQVRAALAAAQAETERPSLICARTVIGFGSPKADTFGVHGAPLGAEGVSEDQGGARLPGGARLLRLGRRRRALQGGRRARRRERGGVAAALPRLCRRSTRNWRQPLRLALDNKLPDGWDSDLPTWEPGVEADLDAQSLRRGDQRLRAEGADLHRRLGRSQPLDQHGDERRRRLRARRPRCSIRARSRGSPAATGATPGATSTSASASTPWAAPPTAWPRTAG